MDGSHRSKNEVSFVGCLRFEFAKGSPSLRHELPDLFVKFSADGTVLLLGDFRGHSIYPEPPKLPFFVSKIQRAIWCKHVLQVAILIIGPNDAKADIGDYFGHGSSRETLRCVLCMVPSTVARVCSYTMLASMIEGRVLRTGIC